MYLVQAANYILPVITFPYLVRVLGIENYGLLAFVAAFIQYFVVFTDYGFNLVATREISLNRNDDSRISEICSTVFGVKSILFGISCLVMILLVITVDKFHRNAGLYLVSLLAATGNLLYPVWFYQGIEKLRTISLINLSTRLVATAAIFIFVKDSGDLIIAAIVQNGGATLSGLVGFIGVFVLRKVRLRLPSVRQIKEAFINGWYIFASIMSSTLVNNTNMFLLGMLATNREVGYFAVADKTVRIFINMVAPISATIYPHVGKIFAESQKRAIAFLRKVLLICGSGFLLVSLGIFMAADLLTTIISGQKSPQITFLVRIMSVLPFTIFVDNIYGTQILVNIGEGKRFLSALLLPGLLSVAASFIFVPHFQGRATATIFLCSELLILIGMIFHANRKGISLLIDNIL